MAERVYAGERTFGDVLRASVNADDWFALFAAHDVDADDALFAEPLFTIPCNIMPSFVALVGNVDTIIALGAADERDAFMTAAVRQCCVWYFG